LINYLYLYILKEAMKPYQEQNVQQE